MTMETIKEWFLCLVSKKHAETTWLRIDAQDEEKVLRYVNLAVVVLFMLAVFVWGVAAKRIHTYIQLKRHYQVIQEIRG